MSGNQFFLSPNELMTARYGNQINADAHQNALMTQQVHQQQIGGADTEMVGRLAQSLLAMPEEEAAKAYGPGIAYLQQQGFAKRAPPTYPGHAVAQRLAALAVPAIEQYKQGQNQAGWSQILGDNPPAPGTTTSSVAAPPAQPRPMQTTTTEPETGLPVLNRTTPATAPGDTTRLADIHPNLTSIQSPSGAKLTVAADAAPRFQGLIDDLHAAGYTLDPATTGGYNARNIAGTNTPSQHAYGSAIDINWRLNARGANTPSDIPPELARSLAAKHGLTWGGDWTGDTRDPMHFEVARGGAQAPARGVAARTGGTDVAGPGGGSGGPPAAPAAGGGGGMLAGLTPDQQKVVAGMRASGVPFATAMTQIQHFKEQNAAAAQQAQTNLRLERGEQRAVRGEGRDIETHQVAMEVAADKKKKAAEAAAAPEFTGEGPEMQRQHILRYGDPYSPGFHQAWAGEKQSRTTISPTGLVSTPSMSEFRAPLDKDGNPRTDLGEVKIRPGPSAAGIEAARVATVDHERITSAIDHFTDVFKKQGGGSFQAWIDDPTSVPAQQINGAFTAMITTLRSPTYFNTGVLQPAEHAMLLSEGLSPKSWRGLFATPEAMVARLGEIKRAVSVAKNVSRRVAGMEEEPDKAGPAAPTKEIRYDPTGKEDRPMIVARTPDGVAHQFPDGTPDDVIDKAVQGYIAENKQPEGPPSLIQAGLRGLGLGVRDVIETAAAAPGMLADVVTWPMRAGQRALGIPTTAPSDIVRSGVDETGLPEPKSDREKMLSAINRGAIGATLTAGLGSVPAVAAAVPTAARMLTTAIPSQVVGGGTGGAASEATRQQGGGPLLQFGASMLGGGIGASATQGVQLGGRALNALAAPFRQGGREGIVSDVLLSGSSQPNTLMSRLEDGGMNLRLPASPVTTAQQARDPGLLAIELGQRSQVQGGGSPTSVSPAARFRDIEAQRNQVRTEALGGMADQSTPEVRGTAVRGALESAETTMGERVGQLFKQAEPEGGGAYPTGRITEAATGATRMFSEEALGGGVPVELQKVVDDINRVGGSLNFEQLQNVRSRLGQITGEASRAGDKRLSGAAGRIQQALEEVADSPEWMEAIRARREMGSALGRDEAGAAATGKILRTDRYGRPMLADEKVANAAIADVGSVRQTLGATTKAVEDARAAGLPEDQIATLQGQADATRKALQGQFIANLTKRSTTTGVVADAGGNTAELLSPAQFQKFMQANGSVATELFSKEQMAQLQTIAADFAETSMATATSRATGSPTAQNLSVGNFIAKVSRGLIEPNSPMAQTVAGLGPVMKLIYAAPEAATREMLTEAMANPAFARALLERATPETMGRAMGYVQSTLGQRLAEAAKGATVRQASRSLSGEADRQYRGPPPILRNQLLH